MEVENLKDMHAVMETLKINNPKVSDWKVVLVKGSPWVAYEYAVFVDFHEPGIGGRKVIDLFSTTNLAALKKFKYDVLQHWPEIPVR